MRPTAFGNCSGGIAIRVRQVSRTSIAAASEPELSTKIGATGQIVRPGGADEFAKEIALQTRIVSDAAAAAGVKRLLQN